MPVLRVIMPAILAAIAGAAEPVVVAKGDMTLELAVPSGAETGTRFDASSMALRATWRGHALFGSYTHPNYPETNTAAGFAEEYDTGERSQPPGLPAAGEGDGFLKLGVGELRRCGQPYANWRTQPLAARGAWTLGHGPDWSETRWDSPTVGTTACSLIRRVTVREDGFRVDRRLINRGSAPIRTEHYAHQFLSFDAGPLDGGYEIDLGYAPRQPAAVPPPLRLDGRLIGIGPMPAKWTPTDAACLVLDGPSSAEAGSARTVTVRHRGRGIALRITADRTPVRTAIYAAPQVICPESFVDLAVPPGGEAAWSTDYTVAEEH